MYYLVYQDIYTKTQYSGFCSEYIYLIYVYFFLVFKNINILFFILNYLSVSEYDTKMNEHSHLTSHEEIRLVITYLFI